MMDNMDDVLKDVEGKMASSLDFVLDQFSGVRTGKASPALVENVKVDYYGTATRLMELAGISTPEPRLIVISPFDPSALAGIEKAIMAANLGVTPMNDGRVVRVPIPELDEERRTELSKVARRMAEDGRVAIRNERRIANDHAKVIQKDGKITEDDRDQGLKTIQTKTDDYIKKIDDALKAKEIEIMEV
jgi:ribosome recycling factor